MATVAILLATYNGGYYLKELLDSITAQTYKDFRCYIHDDGSSDDTLEICANYAEMDHRFVCLNYPSMHGAKNNFLSLLNYSIEPYCMFCDQDDIWEPTKIEKCLSKMREIENKDKASIVFSNLSICNEKGEKTGKLFFSSSIETKLSLSRVIVGGLVPGCAMMFNRNLQRMMMCYKNKDHICMHDWWAMAVAFASGGSVGYIVDPLIRYRIHGGNTVGINKKDVVSTVINNGKLVFNNMLIKKINRIIEEPRLQSGELLNIININYQNRIFLQEFSIIGLKSKWRRMKFYLYNFQSWEYLPRYLLFV